MLRRYDLPSDKTGEGWAKIVIDTDCGFFAAVSDFGNYAYIWTHPGSEFRKFIIGCSAEYFQGKLMMERPNKKVFDGDATYAAVAEAVKALKEENEALYDSETDVLEDYGSTFDDANEFNEWADRSDLGDTWEYSKWTPEPQCKQFCEKVVVRFKAMLTVELAQEKKDGEYAAEILAAKPAIMAAVTAELDAMTGICSKCNGINHKHAAQCPAHGDKKNG